MPYKFEEKKLKIPKKHDKRVKLSDKAKEAIRSLYFEIGGYSQADLARDYKVSRRTIQFVLFPERYEANRKLHRSTSYTKEERTQMMREHRRHKKELYDKGLLLDKA